MPDQVDVAIAVKMRELSPVAGRAGDVKRDMELVRTILRTIIDKADLDPRILNIEGVDKAMLGAHVEMLYEAGFIKGFASQEIRSGYADVFVSNLSWEGYEFAGAILSDEGTWDKLKAAFGPQLATVPLKMIQSVATAALTAWGLKQLGL